MDKKPGREYLDPTPVEWPVGLRVPESLEQKIARMVRTSVSMQAAASGAETFEEADDFDVGDDDEPSSVHELSDDQEAIMRDQQMVRRIPKEFRLAYERETARRRQEFEKELSKSRQSSDLTAPKKGEDSSPT